MYKSSHYGASGTFENIIASLFGIFLLINWLGIYMLIPVGVVILGLAIWYAGPLINSFRKSHSGAAPTFARRFLIVFFMIVSFSMFIALPGSSNAAVYGFIGGFCSAACLHLIGLELEGAPKKFRTRFFPGLAANLSELALIFTLVAGFYAIVTLYLRHSVVNSGTLRQLRVLDERILYARIFLSKIKFSASQTVFIATLLLCLRWLERRYAGHQATVVDKFWPAFRLGTKWMSRVALAALFAASFTLLALRSNGITGEVGTRLRDFEETYTELRGTAEKAVDAELKRDRMSQAWRTASQATRDVIQETIANDIAGSRLNNQYSELRQSFGVREPSIETTLASDPLPITPDFASDTSPAEPKTSFDISPAAQDLSLDSLKRLSAEATQLADHDENNAPPEPAKSLSDVIKTKLFDMGFDDFKKHVKFVEALDAHFPGLGEVIDTAWGAGSDAFLEQRKEAKAKALERKLQSPDVSLKTIVAEQIHGVALEPSRAGLHSASAQQHLRQVASRSAELRDAEASLLKRARAIELKAIQDSAGRVAQMKEQLAALRDLETRPNMLQFERSLSDLPDTQQGSPPLSVTEDFFGDSIPFLPPVRAEPAPGATQPENQGSRAQKAVTSDLAPKSLAGVIRRMQRRRSFSSSGKTSARPNSNFSNKELFPDAALREKLDHSLSTENELQSRIVAIVGRNRTGHLNELVSVLGGDFKRYDDIWRDQQISQSLERRSAEERFPGLSPYPQGIRPERRRPGEFEGRPYEPIRPIEVPHPRPVIP